MAHPVPVLSGVSEIISRYDGFILDLWGCVHDGVKPFPGVLDALMRLKTADKRVMLLSNAPRRAAAAGQFTAKLGVGPEYYESLLSSGEAAWLALKMRDDPWYAPLGTRALKIGPERDNSMLEDNGLTAARDPAEADFVICTGPIEDHFDLAAHEDLLEACRRRNLKMVCANPDLVVMRGEQRLICAGSIAERYIEMGGDVRMEGKPFPSIYARALKMLGVADKRRVIAFGDSLRTDVAGARGAGIDVAFIPGGIHAGELGIVMGQTPEPQAVARMLANVTLHPTYVLPELRW